MINNSEQRDDADKWHHAALKSGRIDDGLNRPI